ncbi:hypothetical protein [Flavobacterium sp. LHD-85]|uniref:hypothetical protein n=1 Tax=Flavobacterium sp. LHD-85 TaxID=3071410 RepID=UPI0027E09873|nr:hypothetical protein [Flavobacterium sp. LHD-85]MDQ6528037.1 hypothetical protein [Flavobacterium sp. LHD-85]
MKIHNIKYLLIAAFTLVFSACDPIVDEQHLSNSTTVENVQLKATNTTAGGNEIKLEMLSPGISGYWDYIIDKALTDTRTITMPVTGTFNFAFKGTLGAEFFEKTIPVTISVLDHPVPPEWGALLGSNAKEGKTWVFDGTAGSGELFWFMSPPNDPNSAMSAWWNAGGECCPPLDVEGKMHFDLDGAPNYNHYQTASAAAEKGSFVLDVTNKKLFIKKSKILGYEAGNSENEYNIITLTEDKLVLYVPKSLKDPKTGWTFVYKPE